MTVYLLIIALLSGLMCIVLTIIEINIIRHFILDNQGQDNIPILTKNDDNLNNIISNFRKKIFSKKMDKQQILSFRKKIRLTDYLSNLFGLITIIAILLLYWTARTDENKVKRTHMIQRERQ